MRVPLLSRSGGVLGATELKLFIYFLTGDKYDDDFRFKKLTPDSYRANSTNSYQVND